MKALFLGAGASYDCGMPLVWELTAELKRWLTPEKLISFNESWISQGGGLHHDVTSLMIRLLNNNELHYENIIGAIEVECSRERDHSKRQNYYSALAFLLQSVHGLLSERQIKNTNFTLNALNDFSSIKKLAEENKPLWVFSLNHDCIIEMLAAKAGIPIKSGFNEETIVNIKDKHGIKHDILFEMLNRESISKNNYDFFGLGELGINIVKLHGSLDIFGINDQLDYLKIKPIDNNPASLAYQLCLILNTNSDIALRDGVVCLNENIYEDENGEIQFLRNSLLSGAHKFTNQLSQIAPSEFLSLFEGFLNGVDELICIGYSFGDKHIDEKIASWLSSERMRKLEIVNPAIAVCPDRMKHLFEQVSCNKIGASDYFIKLNDTTPTTDDIASRRYRVTMREKIRTELLG